MRLDITGRNVAITAPLRQLIDKRLARLERVLNDAAVSAVITLTKEKYRLRTELAVHTRGDHVLRGNGEGTAWPISVRQATEKVEQQAQTLKGKWDGRRRKGVRHARAVRPAPVEAPPERRIIRATRYAVKPMSLEDAALRAGRRIGDLRRVPQRRDGCRQHPVSPQGRPSRVDRAGLSSGVRSLFNPLSHVRSRMNRKRQLDSVCIRSDSHGAAMTESAEPRGVTVATVLRDLADSRALDLELLAGAAGLERRITIPHTQKTGLALSGFDAYLRGGRVLVFGESEVRYLETLTPDDRTAVLQRVFSHGLPCLLITGGFVPPPETLAEADRAGVPLLRTRAGTRRSDVAPLGRRSTHTWRPAASCTAC